MKTILVPTDFSPAADNAARYALRLAQYLKADVKLCHAVKVPSALFVAAGVDAPVRKFAESEAGTDQELKILSGRLLSEDRPEPFTTHHVRLNYCAKAGPVCEVIGQLAVAGQVSMVVMGLWEAMGVNRLFAGSQSHDLIKKATVPLLLIPPSGTFKPVHTIAFATDLSDQDIDVVHSLASLARELNSEILLVHVMDTASGHSTYEAKVIRFLNQISDQVDYARIYYRDVKSKDVDQGLVWLLEHRKIEILAMVHRKHDLLERFFNTSHTQRLARHTQLPLLVFPASSRSVVF
jgi:nucleotide-binding universal stress UspA family protein